MYQTICSFSAVSVVGLSGNFFPFAAPLEICYLRRLPLLASLKGHHGVSLVAEVS